MAALPIYGLSELYQEIAAVLPSGYELFAVNVSSGLSYRESDGSQGFTRTTGSGYCSCQQFARVEVLVNAPEHRVRADIDAELLVLRNRAANKDLDSRAARTSRFG
jgi:hypothetical protein